ncbi:MAG: UDP-3-O-acyl-N-acetylglucosamine deacetylase [Candidatus Omnitrophica bacterium]|nr:UDP-3-O-acyl-N-acetylglucosamine deacetylase [Candidatus Omnitrophota bacterium]
MRRRTKLLNPAVFEGRGVHGGDESRLVCRASAPGSGLRFKRADRGGALIAVIDGAKLPSVSQGAGRSTCLGDGETGIRTVEHFLAAAWALALTDLEIELSGGEMPFLDGSALAFIEGFRRSGVTEASMERPRIRLDEPVFVFGEKSAILFLPEDSFRVTYTLDLRHPLLRGQVVSEGMSPGHFIESIAPARTFCLAEEAGRLREAGYGKGADTSNTLVMGPGGPLENRFRLPQECARHKVLDLVGDLALLGCDLGAHVVSVRGGHQLNHELIRQIDMRRSPARTEQS